MAGFAAGVRPALVLLVVPLGLAFWWRRGAWSRAPWWPVLLAAYGLGYLLAVPYAIAALPALLDGAAAAAREYELRFTPDTLGFFARRAPQAVLTFAQADPLVACSGGLGAVWALVERRRAGLLVLAFLIPSAVLLALHRDLTARHLAPYGPFIALLGGAFLDALWGIGLRRPRPRKRRKGSRATAGRPTAGE